ASPQPSSDRDGCGSGTRTGVLLRNYPKTKTHAPTMRATLSNFSTVSRSIGRTFASEGWIVIGPPSGQFVTAENVIQALRREFDVTPDSTYRNPSMRRGY